MGLVASCHVGMRWQGTTRGPGSEQLSPTASASPRTVRHKCFLSITDLDYDILSYEPTGRGIVSLFAH